MNAPKAHPLNVSYLVVGLVFLGVAGSWALRTSGVVDTGDIRWLVPAVLLVAGAVGLVAFAAKGISRGRQERNADTTDALDEPWTPYAGDTTEPTTGLDTDTTRIEGDDR
jgi:hypothetical protein